MFEKHYSWDTTAETWMSIIDDCPFADWKQPLNIIRPSQINMKEVSDEKFLKELLDVYCYYDKHKDSHFTRNLLSDLTKGTTKISWDDHFSHECTPFNTNAQKPVNRQDILNILAKRLHNYNVWEDVRVNRSKLIDGDEPWLN